MTKVQTSPVFKKLWSYRANDINFEHLAILCSGVGVLMCIGINRIIYIMYIRTYLASYVMYHAGAA